MDRKQVKTFRMGVAEAFVAAVLLGAPEPTMVTKVGGWALLLHAADTASSGVMEVVMGDFQKTMTEHGVSKFLQNGGLDPKTADMIAMYADTFAGVFGTAGATSLGVKGAQATGAVGAASRVTPEIGKKLDYVFGKATGSLHNIERSQGMLRQLESIGLYDTLANRKLLLQHFDDVLNDASSILKIQDNGRIVRESLLVGPNGVVKVESIWDGSKLITAKVYGGG